jgi:hypothetical protein
MERASVHVEGEDDQHAIVHLLIRHRVDYDAKPWPSQFPEFRVVGGIDRLLAGMQTAVVMSGARAVGFVLDADSPLPDRWRAVRDRLARAGVDAPREPPPGGFIGESDRYRARVGVWLMPDNQHDGKLETLLRTLVDEEDPLIAHAESSTDAATDLGAKFGDAGRMKAIVHAWLAWQEQPGLPYGTAIRARYFRHDSPAAAAFAAWFKRLYRIS